MSDRDLRQSVIDELEWDPSFNAAHIGVAVDKGVVTLTGHVGSYAEKVAAERAAKRVSGVRGVALEIDVRYPNDKKTADDQIARRALDILSWNTSIPEDTISVTVQNGWVNLNGEVKWGYQRMEAEVVVRKLTGVVGITNAIKVMAPVAAPDVKSRIEKALQRNAETEANAIRVSVSGSKVILEGRVKAWYERDLAERTAWSAPGVTLVEDRISVGS